MSYTEGSGRMEMRPGLRPQSFLNPNLEVYNRLPGKGRFFSDADRRLARYPNHTHTTCYIGPSGVGKSVLAEQRRESRKDNFELNSELEDKGRDLVQISLSQAEMFNYLTEQGIINSPFGEWTESDAMAASFGIAVSVWESSLYLPHLTTSRGKKATPTIDIDAVGFTDFGRPFSWVEAVGEDRLTSAVALWGEKSLENKNINFRVEVAFAKTSQDIRELWKKYSMKNDFPMESGKDVELYKSSMGNPQAMDLVRTILGRIAEKNQSAIGRGNFTREQLEANPEFEEGVYKGLFNYILGPHNWNLRYFLVTTNRMLKGQEIHHYGNGNSISLINLIKDGEIPVNLPERILYLKKRIEQGYPASLRKTA